MSQSKQTTYRILLDEKHTGMVSGIGHISEEGAKFIYAAYITQFGTYQSMERREERGGICWLSEIKMWIKQGLLPDDFDWKKYEVSINS